MYHSERKQRTRYFIFFIQASYVYHVYSVLLLEQPTLSFLMFLFEHKLCKQPCSKNIWSGNINHRGAVVVETGKVHIFLESHKILRNLHGRFDWHYIGQMYTGDFSKFCGFLRIYELYSDCLVHAVL